MNEVREKTNKILNNDPDLYSGVMHWISGNCWSNAYITNGYSQIPNINTYIVNSINKSIEIVEQMNKPLVLFHGFEKYSNYNEYTFKVGTKFTFGGILSKTSCFRIAQMFACCQNYLQPKYLVVFYSIGSKQIGMDIKLKQFDEYEYINKQGESFEITDIYRRFNGIILETFYICKSLDL